MKPKIEWIDYGIAFTVEDKGTRWIQINKALLEYPDLYKIALEHEMGHIKRNGYLSNILSDIMSSWKLSNLKFLKFHIKNPRSLLASMPIYKENGKIVYNISSITMWLMLLIAIGVSVWVNI